MATAPPPPPPPLPSLILSNTQPPPPVPAPAAMPFFYNENYPVQETGLPSSAEPPYGTQAPDLPAPPPQGHPVPNHPSTSDEKACPPVQETDPAPQTQNGNQGGWPGQNS